MGIKFLTNEKAYQVSYSKRHPITRVPINRTRKCCIDKNGIRRPISSKAEANRVFRKLVIEVEEVITRKRIPTWEKLLTDFEPYYLSTGVTPKTVSTYLLCLNKHTSEWRLLGCEQVTDSMIRELLGNLDSSSVSHQKNILKFIRRVFQFAIEKGYINRNPTPIIKFKIGAKNSKVLKEHEIKTLLIKARREQCEWYHHWALALYTGMRNGELYALRWNNVDWDANLIRVESSWNNKDGFKTTKSGDERLIEIAPSLASLLKELKIQGHDIEFVLPRIPQWEKGEQARCLRMFLMGCGLPVIRFHDLRASWATLLLNRGVEPIKVMAMGGWKDIKTMMIYARKAGVDLKGSTDCLNGLHDPSGSKPEVIKLFSETI